MDSKKTKKNGMFLIEMKSVPLQKNEKQPNFTCFYLIERNDFGPFQLFLLYFGIEGLFPVRFGNF